MESIYYSETEEILFYVAGYKDNTADVNSIVKMLQDGAGYIKFIIKDDSAIVKTRLIEKSSRYKRMRIFYTSVKNPPIGAFQLGEDWTMIKWLEF